MTGATTRNLRWPAFLAIVVAYLAIIKVGGLLIGAGLENNTDSAYPTAEALFRELIAPIALSLCFGAAIATWLGWWGEILHDGKPVRRWVRFVPISMLVASVLAIAYPNLLDQKLGLVLALVLLVVLVGCGEELMFRGIGVVTFRRGGFSEGKVALYSSLIFGLAHVSNAIATGPQALAQALVVSFAGYYLYLSRRVGAGLLLPILVHSTWDFSLLSAEIGPDPDTYPGGLLPVLLMIGLAILLYRRRKQIEPAEPAAASG